MSYRKIKIEATIDWFTIILYLLLVIAGWFSIYAASYDYDQKSILDLSGRAGMQMIWILSSLLIGFSLLLVEESWYEYFSLWIYFAIIAVLILTIAVAPDIKGSRSWLVLGPIRIQPAEFAKFATALAVAKVMSAHNFEIMKPKSLATILCFIFLPMLLILLQKEAGSALVFAAFILVLYRAGMPGAVLFFGCVLIALFVLAVRFSTALWHGTPVGELLGLAVIFLSILALFAIQPARRPRIKNLFLLALIAGAGGWIISFFLPFNWCWALQMLLASSVLLFFIWRFKYKSSAYWWFICFTIASIGFLYSVDYVFDELGPHQKKRIEVALGVVDDPSGAGYNVNQSKIAIGSGGLFGKGYMNGTQTKLKYVPEQDTDFIFCTIGEEEGFLGAAATMLLFITLIIRLIFLAERNRSLFARMYGYSVAALIFFHLTINIGMVIGLTPVIGIPLPFFSYGGSSLWSFTILLFIFLRLDASRREQW
jgi:rod shape determining protein RodA